MELGGNLKIKLLMKPSTFRCWVVHVDLVDGTFGKSSLTPKEEMMPLRNDVAEMLKIVKRM